MYQVQWDKDYEVKVIYPFRLSRVLFIIVILNLLWVWLFSKLNPWLGLKLDLILLSHLGVTIIACFLILKLEIRSESLLVIPSVGINVTYANRLGQVYTEFYSRQLVMDLVIVEAIIMQKLATYPVILYHDSFTREMKIKPLFMKCRLKMAELKSIYQKVQKNLRFTSSEKKS
ncbi:uncharacterized protein LOC128175915 isoform X2 [Crassostrea angulata]|uniref:uncharacterized protein LOC128175915 isoform X2 n=1 Tax=Magallana angulata TaxID=2784310 RepID=UPI0022B0E372|nr:uncharacterized protein LOC128175915 isoform X2 [Crassostrea angulata]